MAPPAHPSPGCHRALHLDRDCPGPRQPLTQARAGQAAGPGDLMAILRDHGGVAPHYRLLNGAMASPRMHAGGVAAGSQTTASRVAELTPGGARPAGRPGRLSSRRSIKEQRPGSPARLPQ